MLGANHVEEAATVTSIRDLETVVTQGLCTGCGICESMLGRDKIEMRLTSFGQLRPHIKQPLDTAGLDAVLKVCPGVGITGPQAPAPGEPSILDPVWGPVVSIQKSWAGRNDIRHWSAAGGTLTALGCYLLESGKVEAVLHVKASAALPAFTEAQVSRTPQEVIAGAQSRYGPGAALTPVMELLDAGTRFAVIAKPCDIAAIRNLAKIDPRVEKQIPYCLTIFCGGVPTIHTAHKIAAYRGVAPEQLSVFRWRGNGWPGPTHIETTDGRSIDLTYDEVWYDSSVPWTYDIQFRCKICPDAIGELADIAAPDGWVMEGGQPIHREAPGANIAIARTAAGQKLLEAAATAGVLVLDKFTLPEMYPMHGDHLDRKLGSPARNLGMALAGIPRLQVRGYRAWAAIKRHGLVANLRAVLGAFRRARAGANREPLT
jgi:coenzyme F420 hydrogenase subunit beta